MNVSLRSTAWTVAVALVAAKPELAQQLESEFERWLTDAKTGR